MKLTLKPETYLVKEVGELKPNNDVVEVEVITIPNPEERVKVKDHLLIGKFSGWKYEGFLIINRNDIIAKLNK